MKRSDIVDIIFQSIDELNKENDLEISKDVNTKLFGSESNLDSLGLINLITFIEEKIETATGKYITIADERAMSQESTPFKTVDTLTNYIEVLVNE